MKELFDILWDLVIHTFDLFILIFCAICVTGFFFNEVTYEKASMCVFILLLLKLRDIDVKLREQKK